MQNLRTPNNLYDKMDYFREEAREVLESDKTYGKLWLYALLDREKDFKKALCKYEDDQRENAALANAE
jgi:predicted NUDIX family phosphoesterase